MAEIKTRGIRIDVRVPGAHDDDDPSFEKVMFSIFQVVGYHSAECISS